MNKPAGSEKSEKIVIMGFGWVGQANALALAKMGWPVFYYDIVTPAHHYADQYEDLYKDISGLRQPLEADGENTWYIVCVGDRTREDGIQDISLIQQVLKLLHNAQGRIIIRSTILPQNLGQLKFDFYLPEFLHEKMAVEECLAPFYFVIGRPANGTTPEPRFFAEWEKRSYKIFRGTPEQAAYIKYLSNIWNALRIAFINEFGDAIIEPTDKQQLKEVEKVVDFVLERGNYLRYGRSYGGHCLPKDTHAFATAFAAPLIRGIYESNLRHQQVEHRYVDLPEWFSFWDYRGRKNLGGQVRRALDGFNSLKTIRQLRRRLKPLLIRTYDLMAGERSLADMARIWNKRAEENARFYVQTKTKSGQAVDEFELRATGAADYRRYVAEDEIIHQRLGDWADKTVLEIGCGIGRMTEFFSPHWQTVSGIDISEEMIKNAKKRLAQLTNIKVNLNDGESIPFPEAHFDFIFSYLVLQHVPTVLSLEQYLRHIYRTLKPGGLAKIQLRTGPGIRKWKWSYGVSLPVAEGRDLAAKTGFTIITHEVESTKNLWLWLAK